MQPSPETCIPTARPPAAVLGTLQELIAAICLLPEWQREEILQCLESTRDGSSDWPQQSPPCIRTESKVVFVDQSADAVHDETSKTDGSSE